jgi:hypothetical protein
MEEVANKREYEEPRFAIIQRVVEFLDDLSPGEQIVVRCNPEGSNPEWSVIFEPIPSEEKVSD